MTSVDDENDLVYLRMMGRRDELAVTMMSVCRRGIARRVSFESLRPLELALTVQLEQDWRRHDDVG